MHEKNSSGWYQDLVERLSQGALTVARIAVLVPHEVMILVEEDRADVIARTEQLLGAFVSEGTTAKVLSLRAFAEAGRPLVAR